VGVGVGDDVMNERDMYIRHTVDVGMHMKVREGGREGRYL